MPRIEDGVRVLLAVMVAAVLICPAMAAQEATCQKASLPALERGYALLHSFEYEWARLKFQVATMADPECALAHVGEALTYNRTLRQAPTEQETTLARASLLRARAASTGRSRDREFVQAVMLLFQDGRSTSRATRNRQYHEALAALHAARPEDTEIAAFYGLSFLGLSAGRVTPDLKHKEAAARFLWPVFQAGPDHPGVMHYLVHALDSTPETAQRGLPVARRYASMQPDVPQAQHMPAHLYFRLGMWKEAMEATEVADRASLALLQRLGWPPQKRHLENARWKMYAYLQRGRREEARKFLLEIKELAEATKSTDAIGAYVSMHTRYLLDGHRWREAAASRPQFFWYQEVGDLAHAKVIGAAFLGDRGRARQGLALLQRSARPTVPRLQAEAALAMMDGDLESVRGFMEQALRMEDAQLARSPMPLPALPGHELFGEMLLYLGKPQQAQDEFTISRRYRLHRPASLLGLARSAALLGDRAKARVLAAEFLQWWSDADTDLPELVDARSLVDPEERRSTQE